MEGKPDHHCRKAVRTPLTPAMSAALRAEIERTGIGPHVLLKNHLLNPDGINQGLLYRWVSGTTRTVCPPRYELALRAWRRLPGINDRFVLNTSEIRALMRGQRKRTGVGVVKLLSAQGDLPEGLDARQVENFFRGFIGKIRRDHLDFVMERWRALPSREFVWLIPEILAMLRAHIARTGRGPVAILRGAKGKPDGLNARVIAGWLDGTAKARKDHLDYVLKLYTAPVLERSRSGRPNPRKSRPGTRQKVPLTPEIRAALHGHWMRAGLSIADFFRTIEDPPVGLTCGMVRRWLSDNAPRRVRKDHLECVLAAWEKLPAGQGHPRSIHFIPFAGEGRQEEIPLR